MFSNWPTMLQQQDFQASNRDMLVAARGGEALSAEEIAAARKPDTIIVKVQRHDHEAAKYLPRNDYLAIMAEASRRFKQCAEGAAANSDLGSITARIGHAQRLRMIQAFAKSGLLAKHSVVGAPIGPAQVLGALALQHDQEPHLKEVALA